MDGRGLVASCIRSFVRSFMMRDEEGVRVELKIYKTDADADGVVIR